jgi:hypothetical protein
MRSGGPSACTLSGVSAEAEGMTTSNASFASVEAAPTRENIRVFRARPARLQLCNIVKCLHRPGVADPLSVLYARGPAEASRRLQDSKRKLNVTV